MRLPLPGRGGRGETSLLDRARRYYEEQGLRAVLSLAGFYVPSVLYHRRLGTWPYNRRGQDVFAADWDTLILLDACRYDVFVEQDHGFDGRTEPRTSRAASTSEFIRANCSGRTLHDVVYVSANPWYMKLRDEIDASVYAYYDVHNEPEERPHVDQMYLTTEVALEAAADHPNKRLLVHYAPPHHPLFGPTAEAHLPSIESQLEMGFYERIRRGEIEVDHDVLRRAYAETLAAVCEEAGRVVEAVDGKTVISADHGEMLGERAWPVPMRYYGHVPGLYTDELVTVPWHVCEFDERRTIEAEQPVERTVSVDVDEQLRDLGYKV